MSKRITNAAVERAVSELLELQQHFSARTLGRGDVEHAVRLYRAAAAWARRLGVTGTASVVVDGGGVSNSYRYRATATRVVVDGGVITVERVDARTVSQGDSGLVLCSIECPAGMSAKASGIPGARKYAGRLRW